MNLLTDPWWVDWHSFLIEQRCFDFCSSNFHFNFFKFSFEMFQHFFFAVPPALHFTNCRTLFNNSRSSGASIMIIKEAKQTSTFAASEARRRRRFSPHCTVSRSTYNTKKSASQGRRNKFNILWSFIIKEFVKNPELHKIFIGIILLKKIHVNMVRRRFFIFFLSLRKLHFPVFSRYLRSFTLVH